LIIGKGGEREDNRSRRIILKHVHSSKTRTLHNRDRERDNNLVL
jgi:hypothetical protein